MARPAGGNLLHVDTGRLERAYACDLPWPATSNRRLIPLRGGRRWVPDPKYHAAMLTAIAAIQSQDVPIAALSGSLEIEICVMPPDRRRRDLSNLIKLPEDALVRAGVIADDWLIDRIVIERGEVVRGGRLCLRVCARPEVG
jgi:crossover junction endodeoxyribonuclease RusA